MISVNTMLFPLATLDCSFLAGQHVLGILHCKFYLSSGLWILTIITAFSHGSGEFKFRSTLMQMAFYQWRHLQLSLYECFNTTMFHLSHLLCSRKVFYLISSTSPSISVSLVIFTTLIIRWWDCIIHWLWLQLCK